jgi:hypothetical protein
MFVFPGSRPFAIMFSRGNYPMAVSLIMPAYATLLKNIERVIEERNNEGEVRCCIEEFRKTAINYPCWSAHSKADMDRILDEQLSNKPKSLNLPA